MNLKQYKKITPTKKAGVIVIDINTVIE